MKANDIFFENDSFPGGKNMAIGSLFSYIQILEENNRKLRMLLKLAMHDAKAHDIYGIILLNACQKIEIHLSEKKDTNENLLEFAAQEAREALNMYLEEGSIQHKHRNGLYQQFLAEGAPASEIFSEDIQKLIYNLNAFQNDKKA